MHFCKVYLKSYYFNFFLQKGLYLFKQNHFYRNQTKPTSCVFTVAWNIKHRLTLILTSWNKTWINKSKDGTWHCAFLWLWSLEAFFGMIWWDQCEDTDQKAKFNNAVWWLVPRRMPLSLFLSGLWEKHNTPGPPLTAIYNFGGAVITRDPSLFYPCSCPVVSRAV